MNSDLQNNFLSISDLKATNLVIGPITIDCSTGKVSIKPEITLDEASIEFWRLVSLNFPYLKKKQ